MYELLCSSVSLRWGGFGMGSVSKGRFDRSVAADASISLVIFGELSRLSNFRSISVVNFRE